MWDSLGSPRVHTHLRGHGASTRALDELSDTVSGTDAIRRHRLVHLCESLCGGRDARVNQEQRNKGC